MFDGSESVWLWGVLSRLLRCLLRGCVITGSSRDEVGRVLFVIVIDESVVSSNKNNFLRFFLSFLGILKRDFRSNCLSVRSMLSVPRAIAYCLSEIGSIRRHSLYRSMQ